MATRTVPIPVQFPASGAGQAANVQYRVQDALGVVKIATTRGTLTEITDGTGANGAVYLGSDTIDTTWTFPLVLIGTINGLAIPPAVGLIGAMATSDVRYVNGVAATPQTTPILVDQTSLAAGTWSIISNVGAGEYRLAKSGAYKNSLNNPLDLVRPANAAWATDLTGTTVTFYATKCAANVNTGDAAATWPMSVVTPTGSAQKIRLEVTSAQTANLALGVGTRGYDIKITATGGALSTDVQVLLLGQMTVTP